MTATDADVTAVRAPGTDLAEYVPESRDAGLPAKVHYAKALAASGLLPAAYRKQPANILWAMEYGDMLGLTTMAAITGVHVIEGKPTASAGLISALVRRAGHRLRVRGDTKSATCQIVRADDTGYTFEVTFTIEDAETAGLLEKAVWKKYGASMLKARAITQCARDACEEALFGLHYTPEELGADVDENGVVVTEAAQDASRQPAGQPRGGTIFIDPECLVENEQSRLAERSGGTSAEDPWYVRPAPQDPPGDDSRPWADLAIRQAGSFKTEAEGQQLWRESAAAVIDGRCTPGQATHIQNIINARIRDRRKEASERILATLPEADDWREKIRDLTDTEEAREALDELGRLKAAGTVSEPVAGRRAAAIIARFPKAAVQEGDGGE